MIRRLGQLAMFVACMAAPCRVPEAWPDPGLPATRELFPLSLLSVPYVPLRATPIPQGTSQCSLQVTRSNTFEFSDIIKESLEAAPPGRMMVDRAGAEAFAQAHPSESLIYYFDAEVQHTALTFRHAATADTEVALTLAWQSLDGGFLDGSIEDFHKLGFKQIGRGCIARDQMAIVVIQKGRVVAFSRRATRARAEDPLLTVLHRLCEGAHWTLSLSGSLKVPLTHGSWGHRSRWDASVGMACQWRPSEHAILDLGSSFLFRNIEDKSPSPFTIKNQAAAHLGVECRRWTRVRPYLLLIWSSALASAEPGSNLNKPALIHDAGIHVRLGRGTALTLGYVNNITHNENTADMGIALRLALRIPK